MVERQSNIEVRSLEWPELKAFSLQVYVVSREARQGIYLVGCSRYLGTRFDILRLRVE